MGRKPLKGEIRSQPKIVVTREAYEHLKQTLSLHPELRSDMKTLVSNLITSFLCASLKWHEDKGLFELYNRRLFLDLEAYLKTGWVMKEPFIDALLDIADGATWKKFAETLEKYEKEYRSK